MAEINGRGYNPDYYQQESEDILNYLNRIRPIRPQGILSPRENMLGNLMGLADMSVSDAAADVGMMSGMKCPTGYVHNGNACVPISPESEGEVKPANWNERHYHNDFGYIDPNTASQLGGLLGPLGSMAGYAYANLNNQAARESADYWLGDMAKGIEGVDYKARGEEVDPMKYAFGDVSFDRDRGTDYKVSLGGVVNQPSTGIAGLFGDVLGTPQPMMTTLTPYEANKRAQAYAKYGDGSGLLQKTGAGVMSNVDPMAISQYEAIQAAIKAEEERKRQAAARAASTVSSGSSNTSAYGGSSTTNYASHGGTDTVGTGGGNASRGYSYGGW